MDRKQTMLAAVAFSVWLGGAVCGLPRAEAATTNNIEIREGDLWTPATIVRKEGRRALIRYDDGTEEWVGPDRMRPISAEGVKAGEPAKAPAAEEPPAAAPTDLDGPPIEIAMDKATAPKTVTAPVVRVKATTRPAGNGASFIRLKPDHDTAIQQPARFVVCPDTPNVVLGLPKEGIAPCQILVIDVANPKLVDVRAIDPRGQQIVGAADNGKVLLSKPAGDASTLHVWEYAGKEYKPKANYTFGTGKSARRVRWASLQSPARLILGSDKNECYLIDLKTEKALSSFTAGASENLQCGGSVLSVADGGSSGLMRTSDFAVVSLFKGENAINGLSVDPTGTCAAYVIGGEGIRVIKIAGGAPAGTINGAMVGVKGPIHMLSPELVLVGNRIVYDVKTGMPLCDYASDTLLDAALLPSGQMLLAFREGNGVTIGLASLPDPKVLSLPKTAKPEDFLLVPGSRIYVSGDMSSYGNDEQLVIANLQKALAAAGHKLVPGSAPCRLDVKITAGSAGEAAAAGATAAKAATVRKALPTESDVTVTLYRGEEAIWMQSFHHEAGRPTTAPAGKTAAADDGKPKVGDLATLAIPPYLAPGSVPSKPAGLRRWAIGPNGISPFVDPASATSTAANGEKK